MDEMITRAVDIMIRTDKMRRTLFDGIVKEIGIHRTQHRMLMHISRCGTLTSQKELAELLGITPAAVTGALKKLEADGYVKRTLGHDNRYNQLQITDKGREVVTRTRELFSAVDRELFCGFSVEELDAYVSSLEKMQANISRRAEGETEERKQVK